MHTALLYLSYNPLSMRLYSYNNNALGNMRTNIKWLPFYMEEFHHLCPWTKGCWCLESGIQQRNCWGYIGFTPFVRLSVCPTSRVHSVAPTVLVESFSYLYIL